MKIFYDPIEQDNIDIDDAAASFYLIQLQDGRFKICASTQNLDCSNLRGGDPETRIKEYWPITREQLRAADETRLFTTDADNLQKLRTSPFDLDELNDIFHFNPSFDPVINRPMIFGQSQQELLGVSLLMPSSQIEFMENMQRRARTLGCDENKLSLIVNSARCLDAIRYEWISLESIVTTDIERVREIINSEQCMDAMRSGLISFEALAIADVEIVREIVGSARCMFAMMRGLISFEALLAADPEKTRVVITNECLDAIERGLISFDALLAVDPGKTRAIIFSPLCMDAMRNGLISFESLLGFESLRLYMIQRSESVGEAVFNQQVSWEFLRDLAIDKFELIIFDSKYIKAIQNNEITMEQFNALDIRILIETIENGSFGTIPNNRSH